MSNIIEVARFIAACWEAPSVEARERWARFFLLTDAAIKRYVMECKIGQRDGAALDPRVNSIAAALHFWAFLPLIRDAIAADANINWKESREALAQELAEEWSSRENIDSSHCGPYGTTTAKDFIDDALAYIDRVRAPAP